MEGILEFLTMVGMVGAAFLALAWLGSGTKKRFGRMGQGSKSKDGPIEDDMSEIGMMGGLGGGEMDDLFIGRHALRRSKIADRKRK